MPLVASLRVKMLTHIAWCLGAYANPTGSNACALTAQVLQIAHITSKLHLETNM